MTHEQRAREIARCIDPTTATWRRGLEGVIANALAAVERDALERAVKKAESVVGGFSAVVRLSEDDPELARDPDGPWVLNADVASEIRAMIGGGDES